MWKKINPDEAAPANNGGEAASNPGRPLAGALGESRTASSEPSYHLGRSVCIKGDISGSENLNIDGTVEGKVDFSGHDLTIGPNARINADITARRVTVKGGVEGSIQADEMLEIDSTGSVVVTDIRSSRISIAEGARFKGCLDIKGSEGKVPAKPQKARAAKTSIINLD